MAVPQLYYFTIRGWGEYIRLLLTDNNVKFEDIRYVYGDKEWDDVKKNMIFGQMPCLKMDGKELAQTGTIMRHLGRKYNINGSNEDEATFIDMIFEGVRDGRIKYVRHIYHNEGTHDEVVNKVLPEHLEKLEKLFNIHSGDFIIGNKISYADFALFEELDIYHHLNKKILDKFPGLKGFWERMNNRPNLKAYLAKRKADGVRISAVEKGTNY